jgi:hypothetical protein
VVSIAWRHSIRRATLDDHGSIVVALVCPRNEDAAAALAVCFWCGILRPAQSVTPAAVEGYHPCFPCEGFYPLEVKPVPRGKAGSWGAQVHGWL